MKKRIKHFLQENDELEDLSKKNNNQDPDYLALLIDDLKKEAERMPVYSMWHEVVKKCLTDDIERPTDN